MKTAQNIGYTINLSLTQELENFPIKNTKWKITRKENTIYFIYKEKIAEFIFTIYSNTKHEIIFNNYTRKVYAIRRKGVGTKALKELESGFQFLSTILKKDVELRFTNDDQKDVIPWLLKNGYENMGDYFSKYLYYEEEEQ